MTDLISRADAIEALAMLPSAENSNAKTQNSNQETQKSNGDLIKRADVIEAVRKELVCDGRHEAHDKTCRFIADVLLSALPSAETHDKRTETHGVCLISKADAMGAVQDHFNANGFKGYDDGQKMMDRIKALPSAEAEPKMTEEVREALMRLTMCAREECDMCKYKDKCGFEFQYNISTENMNTILDALSAEADGANLINRHDAVTVIREECWKCNNMINDDLFMRIMSLPTSRQTDCTEFIMWLVEVVLDDEDWELNAVAYGEVIARKLKKLGLLEVKDGYYIRHTAHRPKGEWIFNPKDAIELMFTKPKCSECGFESSDGGNFCSNCGARMKGGAE